MALDAIGTYVLVLAMATVFVMVILLRQNRAGNDVPIWLSSGLVGLLLGGAVSAALVKGLGYDVVLAPSTSSPDAGGAASGDGTPAGGPGAMGPGSAGGMGMGGMGMGPPGGMGGGMGMMGGGRGPNPKRELTTLVRKLDLLTGDIALHLTPEQSATIKGMLDEIDAMEKMTDEEATALRDKLLAVLDEEQKARQEAIGLPFRRGGGFGGPSGAAPGGRPTGSPSPPGLGGAGGGSDPEANPFHDQQENKSSLASLRERLGGNSPTP